MIDNAKRKFLRLICKVKGHKVVVLKHRDYPDDVWTTCDRCGEYDGNPFMLTLHQRKVWNG